MKVAGIIIVIVLIAFGVFVFFQWGAVPGILSRTLSEKLGAPANISSVSLTPSSISISNVRIGNPAHYRELSQSFTTKSIDINAPLTNYLNDYIVIEEIDIRDVYLGLIFDNIKSASGNWTVMMSNLKASQKSNTSEKNNKKVLIKRLVLTNISVDMVYVGDGKVRHLPKIDRLEFTNITSEGGIPTEQIMNSVLGQMLYSVFEKENIKNMLENVLDRVPGQQFLQPFKGLFGG